MATAEKISAKAAAIEIGTDARTLRKFLRSDDCPLDPVGQGNRYEFTKGEVKKLKKLFLAWSGSSTTKKTKVITSEDIIEDTDEVEEIDLDDEVEDTLEESMDDVDEDWSDSIEDLEPTDEDLEDIEIEDID